LNFFQNQEHARSQTRWLVVLFILAVLAIVAAVDLALMVAFGLGAQEGAAPLFSAQALGANLPLLAGGALGTGAIIGLASLFKTASLRSGGGKVARDLGGTLVDADVRDPLRRRLRNVVEEIALASGVPVPEIYVLEQESGINAFAAGYSPSDAAVAVTRGAMEKLSRTELQGVIAHEFSHILNGDMRLNIRLMGALFGILMLALIGRRVLHNAHFMGRSRNNNGAPIMIIALAITLVGYIGLFFGRWIKSAVSRQREYLADASAVQFTRDPGSISGALKKIAIDGNASYLNVDSEEVGHMLFGAGQRMNLFATHPPLVQRIQRIEPQFREEELVDLARQLHRKSEQVEQRRERASATQEPGSGPGGKFDARNIIDHIGNPQWERFLMAAAVAASVPDQVSEAAHSADWAPDVLFYTLLDRNPDAREQQMLIIAQQMGSESDARLRSLLRSSGPLKPEHRLPVMEVALPSLKRHPPEFVKQVLRTINAVIHVDGRIDVFEYLLARVVSRYLWEAANPHSARSSGHKSVPKLLPEVAMVLAILARHGHSDEVQAERAYQVGMAGIAADGAPAMPDTGDWIKALDSALDRLDHLHMPDKEILVRALIASVTADNEVVAEELELLRAVCAMLHVPLPMMPSG
jgi:Zn-dependent protease with chaperone function